MFSQGFEGTLCLNPQNRLPLKVHIALSETWAIKLPSFTPKKTVINIDIAMRKCKGECSERQYYVSIEIFFGQRNTNFAGV